MTDRDFSSLRDILDRSPVMRLLREQDRYQELRGIWLEVVGEEVFRNTRLVKYRGGKLHIDVLSPPLLLELSSFRKKQIMNELKRTDKLKGIIDIVFRSG